MAIALLDCRLLPGWAIERWIAEVRRIINDDTIKIEVVLNFATPESPLGTTLHAAIGRAVKQLYPAAGLAESPSTGFNDSHWFREKGIVSYGFVPFALKDSELLGVHGNDERIPLKAYTDGVRLEWEVVYSFCHSQ